MTLFSEFPDVELLDQEPGALDPESAGLEQAALEPEALDLAAEGIPLEPELRYDVPGCESAWVIGDPYGLADRIDYLQGDNPFRAEGNCGLMAVRNMMALAGREISEDQITEFAINNNLCIYDPYGPPEQNGGTYAMDRRNILSAMGIESDIFGPGFGGTLEDIADAIAGGRGVLITVNAGVLWDCDDGAAIVNGMPQANHCVAVTGVARDAATGEIKGVYIADSGRGLSGDACRFLTTEEFHEAYTNAYGSAANITRDPIMGG